eukprot:1175950-Prorocentrum_minimum.AAC.1
MLDPSDSLALNNLVYLRKRCACVSPLAECSAPSRPPLDPSTRSSLLGILDVHNVDTPGIPHFKSGSEAHGRQNV